MIFWATMAVVVLAALAGYIRGRYGLGNAEPSKDPVSVPQAAFWVALGAVTLAFFVGGLVAPIVNEHDTVALRERMGLVAAVDSNRTEDHWAGGFLLFIGGAAGSSSTELNYSWYERDLRTGAIQPHTGVRADEDTDIELFFLKEGERPYVVRRTVRVDGTTPGWIAPVNLNWNSNEAEVDNETWELHVPRGGILRRFKLNLK